MTSLQLRQNAFWFGPFCAFAVGLLLHLQGSPAEAALVALVTVWCAIWWIFEPIPIPATSLIPLALFPLLGIMSGREIAQAVGDPIVLLMMGGAMLSKAMEKSGVHRRLAVGLLRLCGNHNGRRVVIGFMLVSALLSMWISNTATVLMLLPMVMAVVGASDDKRLTTSLLLAIAYGASIGGLATPIGTPPNLIFMRVYQEATGNSVSFLGWMLWAGPVVLILFPLAAWWLSRSLEGTGGIELPGLGAWRPEERWVLLVFSAVAVAWITMDDPYGGWKAMFDVPLANHAAVALSAVALLFCLPNGKNGRLLDWQTAKTIEWGILLLFAGGIAIAQAFVSSGLSAALGEALTGLATLPAWLLVLAICLTVTFLTEVTSNTATATLLMPVLAAAALAASWDPALFMIPAALSASCAFMLPVATPPNAVVFASGHLTVARMASQGFIVNLMGVLTITLVTLFLFGNAA